MFILTAPWFIRDCFFIALTLGLVFTCLSNTQKAIEEPITYFVAITPVYFFTFWIGTCILLTYATVTRAQVQGWGFFIFILCIISGSLLVDPKDSASPCIWEREFERVSNQSESTMFSTEGFFAKANAWLREHRPLIFRPPLASECLDLNFPGIKIHHPWWYTKQDADLMVDLWLRKFGLQNTIFRNHILRLLARSHQILQDLEGDWKHEPDPAKREIILNWRREEFIKLQEEAVCEWQPDYCEWKEGRGYVPSVEGNEGGKDKEVPKSTITPTRQSTGEADEVGSEQEHTGAPQTHMPNTEGERHTVAQNVLSALRTKTESGSVERDDEQNVLEIEHGKSTSESTAEAKSGEPVKSPKSLLKGEVNDSLELSDREDDDVFSDMSGSRYWGLR